MAAGTLSAAQGPHSTALGSAAQAIEENSVSLGSLTVANRGTEEKILLTKSGAASTAGYNVLDDAAHSGTGADKSTWTPTLAAVSVGSAPARLYFASASGDATTTQVTDYPAFRKSDGSLTRDYMDSETYQTYEVAYDEDSTVVTHTRRITNVAAGAADTDAVNVAQLKLVRESSWQVGGNLVQDDDGDITGADGNKYKYVNGPYNVQQGDVVNFVDGDGTTAVTSNTTTITNPDGTTTTINQPSVMYNVNRADAPSTDPASGNPVYTSTTNPGKIEAPTTYNNGTEWGDNNGPAYWDAKQTTDAINSAYWNVQGVDDGGTTYTARPVKAGDTVTIVAGQGLSLTQAPTNTADGDTTLTLKGLSVVDPGSGSTNITQLEDADGKTWNITGGGNGWNIVDVDSGDDTLKRSTQVPDAGSVAFVDGNGTTAVINPSYTYTDANDGKHTVPSVTYNVNRADAPTIANTTTTIGGDTYNPGQVTPPVDDDGNVVNNTYWDARQTADAINNAHWNVQGFNQKTGTTTPTAATTANGPNKVHAGDTVNLVAGDGIWLTQDNGKNQTGAAQEGATTFKIEGMTASKSSDGKTITLYNPNGPSTIIFNSEDVTGSITTAELGVVNEGDKSGTVNVVKGEPGDLTNAGNVSYAINNSYWKATGDSGDELQVKPSSTVNFKGGQTGSTGGTNITVTSTKTDGGGDLEFSLADNIGLTDQGSVTIGDTTSGPSTVINNGNINFYSEPDTPGGGTITGLTTHFDEVTGTNPGGEKNPATTLRNDYGDQAATVNDVLNAGWNLQANGKDVDYVTHNDTVNFASKNGTVKITSDPASTGSLSTINFEVDTSGIQIQTDVIKNTFDDGKGTEYYIDPDTGKVTFNVNEGSVLVNPGTPGQKGNVTQHIGDTPSDANIIPANDPNKYYATVGTVATALEAAAPQYTGDNDQTARPLVKVLSAGPDVSVSPGAGGTLPVRGWSAEYESQPTVGGYSGRNLQVIPRANYGDLALQMSDNPTFGGTAENPNVAISGDQGTISAGTGPTKVVVGSQTVNPSTKVGGGGPNPDSGNYVTGLDNTAWQNGSYVSGRAATEDQLEQVRRSMDLSFSGDRNINVGRSGNHVSIRLNPNVHVDSVTVNDGVYVVDGPSMSTSGINAAGLNITNVAPGVNDTDAVNVSQLRGLEGKMNKMGDRADAGIAGAMAAAAVPQVTMPGKNLLGAGAGYFHDQSAVAVGYSAMSDNGKWIMRINGSVSTEEASASAGVGYQW